MSCCAAYRPMTSRWRAQRTHGTTDPGGVWHPVHRKECLTILLGTYAENDKSIATDDERIVFSTACLCLILSVPPPHVCWPHKRTLLQRRHVHRPTKH